MLTDHKGLKYFMTTEKLIPRQAKWVEFLFKFNFIVNYQTEKKNDKTDALTRKPNKRPANNKNKWHKHRMQTLLLPKCVKMHFIEVIDQLEEDCEPKQPKVRNQLKQQKSVKAKYKEKELKDYKLERQKDVEAEHKHQAEKREKLQELATLPE